VDIVFTGEICGAVTTGVQGRGLINYYFERACFSKVLLLSIMSARPLSSYSSQPLMQDVGDNKLLCTGFDLQFPSYATKSSQTNQMQMTPAAKYKEKVIKQLNLRVGTNTE
jgi:hypothetical protein